MKLKNSKEKSSLLVEITKEQDEILRQCLEKGKACDYGICDECPNILKNCQE